MLFPTLEFAVFFLVVFATNWLLRPRHPQAWRAFMVGASLFFYVWAEWTSWTEWPDVRLGLLLVGSIVANFVFGQRVYVLQWEEDDAAEAGGAAPTRRGVPASVWWVRGAVAFNLGVLGLFKYYGFFSVQVANWLSGAGLDGLIPLAEITLPVGISFYTFQAMSYVIDIGRRDIEPMPFWDFAVYLSFFPQLVAGPIVRATEFAPQLRKTPDPRYVPSTEAIRLILAGLFKKVVISSYLASAIVDDVFANPGAHSGWEVMIGIYAYAIQIYADFSGYTDIAIGVALLLGFRFPQNFNAPYRSLSIQDFWRRWHMTLSRWLRDYLYISLGGNRRGQLFTYRNLMLTMVLGGLWHGAAWNFVVWGIIHGGVLAAERYLSEIFAERPASFAQDLPPELRLIARWLVTFHIVCAAWVFFRAASFGDAIDVFARLGTWSGGAGVVTPLLLLVVFGALAFQFIDESVGEAVQRALGRLSWLQQGLLFGLAILAIDVLGPEGVAPFIYFRF